MPSRAATYAAMTLMRHANILHRKKKKEAQRISESMIEVGGPAPDKFITFLSPSENMRVREELAAMLYAQEVAQEEQAQEEAEEEEEQQE